MATQAPENAGLTEEEIAAMAELDEQMADTDADDPLFNPDEVVKPVAGEQPVDNENGEEEEEQQQEEQEELTPEEQKAKDDQEAADKAKADEEEAAEAAKPKTEAPQQRDPILVAEAPEGAEARLTEIATAKGELAEKFDDGDLTSKEYQAELDKLNKEERTLERAIDKAEIARDLENQRLTNERMADINGFLREVSIPNDPKNMRFSVLNTAVIAVAGEDVDGKLTVREVMEKAYELCVKEGVLPALKAADKPKEEPAKAKAAPRKKVDAPPTLNNLPAADITPTEDNRFAFLNRIKNPDQREAAFMKLSAADQEAYLASGG